MQTVILRVYLCRVTLNQYRWLFLDPVDLELLVMRSGVSEVVRCQPSGHWYIVRMYYRLVWVSGIAVMIRHAMFQQNQGE